MDLRSKRNEITVYSFCVSYSLYDITDYSLLLYKNSYVLGGVCSSDNSYTFCYMMYLTIMDDNYYRSYDNTFILGTLSHFPDWVSFLTSGHGKVSHPLS